MSLLLAGLIMFFGSVVQGTIGFALSMISIPLLVEAGFSLSQAVALATVVTGIQEVFGVYDLRQHIPWGEVKWAASVRLVAVAIGVLLLRSVESLDAELIKQIVGVAVLLGVLIRTLGGRRARGEWPRPLAVAAFSLSGILAGSVGTGGSPIVLWVTSHEFPAKQARAFTMTLLLINAPIQIALMLLLTQTMTADIFLLAGLLTPVIYLGTEIGVRIGNRFDKPTLNKIELVVLVLISLVAIF